MTGGACTTGEATTVAGFVTGAAAGVSGTAGSTGATGAITASRVNGDDGVITPSRTGGTTATTAGCSSSMNSLARIGLRSVFCATCAFDMNGAVIARACITALVASAAPPVQQIAATHQINFFAITQQRGSVPM